MLDSHNQSHETNPLSVPHSDANHEGSQVSVPDISELICHQGENVSELVGDEAGIMDLILESVRSGLLLIDAQAKTIVYANDAAARIMGLPKTEIIGHLCPRDLCPAAAKVYPLSDEGESLDQSERILLTANGTETLIFRTVVPIQWHGRNYWVESLTDITSLKEAQIRQEELMRKLEGMNKELTDFAYIVSHDLKAPLRGIKSLADWIVCDHFSSLNKDGREQLSLLQNRVDRMQDLITGILEYSRLGQVSEHMTEVDLNVLLPDIIDILAIPNHISIDIQKDLPTLQCEKTRISQIFQNLLSNAVKFMDKPQGCIQIQCSDEGDHWRFGIADNGPGIEKQYLEQIFQLFQTLQTGDETDSTGIGLSVVKKSVTMYGGRVWVEADVGQGSVFYFTFPKTVCMR
ncbi:MAG: PAS domain-containing protein [Phycisphaerae bacterium]|nr:PAS domain-containing protein [Phycisphaerae bacterium]